MRIAISLAFMLVVGILLGYTCHAAALPAPDDALTPGETRTGAAHAKRPSLPHSIVIEVSKAYHLTGKPAEWDHRIPWGCKGATSVKNIWPQDKSKVAKDRLEHYVERQVTLHHLTIEACQKMFAAPSDWRDRYRETFGKAP